MCQKWGLDLYFAYQFGYLVNGFVSYANSSLGAFPWTVAGVNEKGDGSTNLGWGFVAGSGQASVLASIDSAGQLISPAVSNANAGIMFGSPATFTFELTGVAADYTDKFVRKGAVCSSKCHPRMALFWIA